MSRFWRTAFRHRIHLGARSFVGPMTMVTPGAALGEGSATMDQTFVPPGMLVPSWRTLMGTSPLAEGCGARPGAKGHSPQE